MAIDTTGLLAWVDDWARRQFGGSIDDTFTGHSAADWVVLGEYAPPGLRSQVDAPLREVALAAGLSESFDWWPYLAQVAREHWQLYGQPFRYLESPVGYLVEGAAGYAAQDHPELAPVVERLGASGYLESTHAQQVARRDEHKAVNRSLNTTIAVALAGGWLAAGAGAGAGAGAAEGAGAGAAAGGATAAEGGSLLYLDALEEGLAAYDFAAPVAAVAESAPWWESWVDTGQGLVGQWAKSRIAQSLAPDRPAPLDVAAAARVPLAPGSFGGASGEGALFSSAATRQMVILGGLGLLAIVAIGVLKK
jgi:hypothetical protein